jgi:hypothetical protein
MLKFPLWVALVACLAATAWALRWDVIEIRGGHEQRSAAILINRWTGELLWVQDGRSLRVEPIP